MKKILILTILLVPALSFGQLKKKDKKAVDKYAEQMCGCVNEVINGLNPKAVEFIVLMSTEGEAAAEEAIIAYITSATEEETAALLASFDEMGTEEFQNNIEDCDFKGGLSSEVGASIDSGSGDGYDYFFTYLEKEDSCKLMKYLLELGMAAEEEGIQE